MMPIHHIQKYMNGHCHVLAMALHRKTGWPLGGYYTHECYEGKIPLHVYVTTPKGTMLDIRGEHDYAHEWYPEFSTFFLREMDADDVQALIDNDEYLYPMPSDEREANQLADKLIQRYHESAEDLRREERSTHHALPRPQRVPHVAT